MMSRESAKNGPSLEGTREVVIHPAIWEPLVDWLYDRGLGVFPLPSDIEGEIPAYSIGPLVFPGFLGDPA